MKENIDWDITIEKLMGELVKGQLDKEQVSTLTELVKSINTIKLIQFYHKEAQLYEYITELFLKNQGDRKEKCVELIKEHAEDILEVISNAVDEIKLLGGPYGK